MMNINGTGTRFLGYSPLDKDGSCFVTNWVTILYLPVIPLYRAKIKRKITLPIEFKYEILDKDKLVLKEVIITYLFGWIIFPLIIFWPFTFSFFSIQRFIGIQNQDLFIIPFSVFALVWVIFISWRLKLWDERRGLPNEQLHFKRTKIY